MAFCGAMLCVLCVGIVMLCDDVICVVRWFCCWLLRVLRPSCFVLMLIVVFVMCCGPCRVVTLRVVVVVLCVGLFWVLIWAICCVYMCCVALF